MKKKPFISLIIVITIGIVIIGYFSSDLYYTRTISVNSEAEANLAIVVENFSEDKVNASLDGRRVIRNSADAFFFRRWQFNVQNQKIYLEITVGNNKTITEEIEIINDDLLFVVLRKTGEDITHHMIYLSEIIWCGNNKRKAVAGT